MLRARRCRTTFIKLADDSRHWFFQAFNPIFFFQILLKNKGRFAAFKGSECQSVLLFESFQIVRVTPVELEVNSGAIKIFFTTNI